jgi:hypothetical protein
LRAARGGLWLFSQEDSIELAKLDYGGLTKKDLQGEIEDADLLVDLFQAGRSRYLLAVVRLGEPEFESNSTEVIVPVDMGYVDQVLNSWEEKRRKKEPGPRPRSRKR